VANCVAASSAAPVAPPAAIRAPICAAPLNADDAIAVVAFAAT
jgi:hypothetical protein